MMPWKNAGELAQMLRDMAMRGERPGQARRAPAPPEKVPAVYEVDEHGEPTGHLFAFCSDACADAFRMEDVPEEYRFAQYRWEMDLRRELPAQYRCDYCEGSIKRHGAGAARPRPPARSPAERTDRVMSQSGVRIVSLERIGTYYGGEPKYRFDTSFPTTGVRKTQASFDNPEDAYRAAEDELHRYQRADRYGNMGEVIGATQVDGRWFGVLNLFHSNT